MMITGGIIRGREGEGGIRGEASCGKVLGQIDLGQRFRA